MFTPAFISRLLTPASVVRSRDFCGLALLLAVFALLALPAHAQNTYTVTNTNSSGSGSLAAAVASVDADTGTPGDTIVFANGLTSTITPTAAGAHLSDYTVTPVNGTLTLSCANLPTNAMCVFTQGGTTNNVVTLSGNTAVTVALAIQTNVAIARLDVLPAIRPTPFSPLGQQSPLSPILPALAFWWPGSMAGLAAFGRKKNLSKARQRMLQLCLLVMMTGALAACISGCAGGVPTNVTPAGTSTVVVTVAPSSSSGQGNQTLNLSVIVTG